MASAFRSQLVGVLAFVQRALGLHRRSRPLDDLSGRSRWTLERLSGPPDSLRFQVTFRQLRSNWDLLTEEAMSDDDALRLQLRVLELAESLPEAERLIRPSLNESQSSQILAVILAQATAQGASEVELRFGTPQEGTIPLIYRIVGQEREFGRIPWDFEESLRGLLRFVQAAGFARIRPYFDPSKGLPNDLAFVWSDPDRLTITLR